MVLGAALLATVGFVGAVLGMAAVLAVERTTFDTGGAAVLVAEHTFPAHLTRFVVDLPNGRLPG